MARFLFVNFLQGSGLLTVATPSSLPLPFLGLAIATQDKCSLKVPDGGCHGRAPLQSAKGLRLTTDVGYIKRNH